MTILPNHLPSQLTWQVMDDILNGRQPVHSGLVDCPVCGVAAMTFCTPGPQHCERLEIVELAVKLTRAATAKHEEDLQQAEIAYRAKRARDARFMLESLRGRL